MKINSNNKPIKNVITNLELVLKAFVYLQNTVKTIGGTHKDVKCRIENARVFNTWLVRDVDPHGLSGANKQAENSRQKTAGICFP